MALESCISQSALYTATFVDEVVDPWIEQGEGVTLKLQTNFEQGDIVVLLGTKNQYEVVNQAACPSVYNDGSLCFDINKQKVYDLAANETLSLAVVTATVDGLLNSYALRLKKMAIPTDKPYLRNMWVMPMPEGSVTEAIQLTPPFDPSAGGQTLTAMVPHFVKDVRVYYEKRTGDRVKATWLDQSVNASPRRRMLLQNGTLPGTVANATNVTLPQNGTVPEMVAACSGRVT